MHKSGKEPSASMTLSVLRSGLPASSTGRTLQFYCLTVVILAHQYTSHIILRTAFKKKKKKMEEQVNHMSLDTACNHIKF